MNVCVRVCQRVMNISSDPALKEPTKKKGFRPDSAAKKHGQLCCKASFNWVCPSFDPILDSFYFFVWALFVLPSWKSVMFCMVNSSRKLLALLGSLWKLPIRFLVMPTSYGSRRICTRVAVFFREMLKFARKMNASCGSPSIELRWSKTTPNTTGWLAVTKFHNDFCQPCSSAGRPFRPLFSDPEVPENDWHRTVVETGARGSSNNTNKDHNGSTHIFHRFPAGGGPSSGPVEPQYGHR